jgi:hypothetical protein
LFHFAQLETAAGARHLAHPLHAAAVNVLVDGLPGLPLEKAQEVEFARTIAVQQGMIPAG